MPYIGRGPAKSGAFRILDDVSGSFNGSTTTFALTVASTALTVGLPETLTIAVDGVVQEPGSAYTISGSNIVFGSAPQADATFWGVELGDVGGIALTVANDAVNIAGLSATGTASSSTFLRGDNAWAAPAGGAVVLEGSNTDGTGSYQTNGVEATSTSTSWVDLLALSSLSIAANEPFMVTVAARKTTGHGSGSGLAHKVNSTALSSSLGPSGDDPPWVASNDNSAQDGSPWSFCSPRVTNYLNGVNTVAHATLSANSSANTTTYMSDSGMYNSGVPNAVIATWTFTGINDNSANTVGADEGHIYSLAVS